MTWWPSVPTSALIAPTIAGSSSTTRIRRERPVIDASSAGDGGRQGHDEPRAAGWRRRLAPDSATHGFREPLGRVEPDARSAGSVGVAPGIGLEDPFPPLVRNARPLVADAQPGDALLDPPIDRDRGVRRRV